MEKNHTHIMHLFIYNILIYCSIYQNAFFFNKFKYHLLQLIAYIECIYLFLFPYLKKS